MSDQYAISGDSITISLRFAEWMDINAIRTNRHEWESKHDNYMCRYSTEEMWIVFLKERDE